MRSDALPALIRRRKANFRPGKLRKRLRKPKRWMPPDSVAREYTRALWGLVAEVNRAIEENLFPHLPDLVEQANATRPDSIRADDVIDWAEKTAQLMIKTRTGFEKRRKADPERLAMIFAEQASDWNDKEFKAVVKSAMGVDPFVREPWLKAELNGFAKQNAALIKSLSEEHFKDIEGIVHRGLAAGRRHEEIAKELHQRFEVPKNRASLIARDQISKLDGQLTRLRQTGLGLSRYTWRTSRDERVRSKHRAREGKVYRWDDPPEGGHPQEEIQCRCKAKPIFDDLLEGTGKKERPETGKPKQKAKSAPLVEQVRKKTREFAEDVSLPGITASQLVRINLGLEAVFSTQEMTRLGHVGWIGKKQAQAAGWYAHPMGSVPAGTDYIEFQKTFVKNAKVRAARQEANLQAWKTQTLKRLQRRIDDPATPKSVRRELKKQRALAGKIKRYTVASDSDDPIKGLAAHEAGHALYYQDRELARRWEAALERYEVGTEDRFELSRYGASSDTELFAETAAAIALGRGNMIPKKIKMAYNDALKGWRRR